MCQSREKCSLVQVCLLITFNLKTCVCFLTGLGDKGRDDLVRRDFQTTVVILRVYGVFLVYSCYVVGNSSDISSPQNE